jgi:hypothetical protein
MTKPRAPQEQPEQARTTTVQIQDELELRRARYSHIEREADAMGRIIGVRRIKLSEITRLTAMTPDLGGMDEIQNPDQPGATMLVQQRSQYIIVAMVCEINNAHIPFARNRGELDAIMDRLDREGMEAAGIAAMRLMAEDATEGTPIERAKNLSGIPGSE